MSRSMVVADRIRRTVRLLIALVGTGMIAFITGCTQADFNNSDIYKSIEQQTQTFSQVATSEGVWWQRLTQKIFETSNALKAVAPVIILGSVLIGCILLRLIEKEQKLRQKAIGLFIIGIPLLTIIATYGLAFIAGMFL